MPLLPFTPTPGSVDVASPLGVNVAEDVLARAIDEQHYVEPGHCRSRSPARAHRAPRRRIRLLASGAE